MHKLGCPARNNPGYADCECAAMDQREHTEQLRRYNENAERAIHIVTRDPDRIQCEHIAEQVWIHLASINHQADLAGQVQQCAYAVKGEFVRLVADIIQKELGK